MKMAKAIRQKAATAEWVAVDTADTYVVNQMRTLAQAFRAQAEIIKKNKKKKKKMSFSIKRCASTANSSIAGRPPKPPQEGSGDVASRLLSHLHHHARRTGLPLIRVCRFASYARRQAIDLENSPTR